MWVYFWYPFLPGGLFEIINARTGNWIYEGRAEFTDLEYFFWGSLSFRL